MGAADMNNGNTIDVVCSAKVTVGSSAHDVTLYQSYAFDADHHIKSMHVDVNRMDLIVEFRKKVHLEKEPHSAYNVNIKMTWVICGFLGVLVMLGLYAARPKEIHSGSEHLLKSVA